MKLKTTVLALTALMLGSLASAEPAKQSGDQLHQAPAPAVSSSCNADGSAAQLPFQNPAALPASPTCGSCSDQWCPGYTVGSYCTYLGRFGYQQGSCQLAGGVCSNGVGLQCACVGGIAPQD
jgi:hypothetical protein